MARIPLRLIAGRPETEERVLAGVAVPVCELHYRSANAGPRRVASPGPPAA